MGIFRKRGKKDSEKQKSIDDVKAKIDLFKKKANPLILIEDR